MKSEQNVAEYSKKNILILPEALLEMNDAKCLMHHGASAIFYKDLDQDLVDVEFFCNVPCFVYIKSGRERITSCEEKFHQMEEGSITFLPQGMNLHSDYVRTSQSLKAFLLFLDEDVVRDFLTSQRNFGLSEKVKTQDKTPHFYTYQDSKALVGFFEGIFNLHRQGLTSQELLRLKLLEFLQILTLTNNTSSLTGILSKTKTFSHKRNVTRLMNKPEMLRLSVADLAKLSGRSLSSFNRDFRARYDMPPKQWLKEKRLAYAHKLLLEKGLSVTEASLEAGYENVSHFIKSFKNNYGFTPKELKIQNQKNNLQ